MTAAPPREWLARHVGALQAAARAARAAGQAGVQWLLASRLVRLSDGRDAGAFLLRAQAHGALGAAEAARADVAAAFRVDPAVPGVAEAFIASLPAGEDRRAALLHRLRVGDEPSATLLNLVAREGWPALVQAVAGEGEIAGSLHWFTPERPVLTLRHDGGEEAVSLQPSAPDTPRRAAFHHPWPAGAAFAALVCPGALVVPEGLVAPQPVLPAPAAAPAGEASLLVVVPVYADLPSLTRCLRSLRAGGHNAARIVLVDDTTPDAALRAALEDYAATDSTVTLLRNPVNLGFSGSVNRGLALRQAGEDVLILNSDATLPPGALARLQALAHREAGVGTLTPLSNNGEDTSLPRRFLINPEPDDALLATLDASAAEANAETLVEIPNGVGFCLFVTAQALEQVGAFSGGFERGYFEDVDFCLRIAQAGYRNLCATGIYVAHAGSRSFGGEREAYIRRNMVRLSERHPGFLTAAADFLAADPLKAPAEALARAFLFRAPPARIAVAPQDCPVAYARAMAASQAPQLLLRPSGTGWEAHHLDPAFAFSAWLSSEEGAVLLARAREAVGVIESPRLPPAHRLALAGLAQAPVSARPAPAAGPVPEGLSCLGIACPEMGEAEEAALQALQASMPGIHLVFLDELALDRELRFWRSAPCTFAGDVGAAELPLYQRLGGLQGVLFAHPLYGRHDPRRAAARTAGLAVYDAVLAR